MLQMDDALRARAERLKQMCNALANLHAYKLTNLGQLLTSGGDATLDRW